MGRIHLAEVATPERSQRSPETTGGAALKLDANKIAETESSATERVI